MAYGQTDVNSGARGGEFLTGNLNYFTIKTIVPCYPTNVKTPLDVALKARNWTSLSASRAITVEDANGGYSVYDSNAEYTSAYNKQQNLNTLLSVFSTRANPVVVNVSAQLIADPSTTNAAFASGAVVTDEFGGDYVSANTAMYTINLVIEKGGSWLVTGTGAGNNTDGYELLNVLNNVPALSTTAATPAGPGGGLPNAQDNGAIALTVGGGVFNALAANAGRNVVAKASDSLPAIA